MKIINKTEKVNELLSRKEIVVTVEYEGVTPTKADVLGLLDTNKELTIVKDVIVGFKTNVAKCEIYEYGNAENMKRIEALQMHKKIEEKIKASEEAAKKADEEAAAAKEAEAKAEEAKEAPAEEAPAEEETSSPETPAEEAKEAKEAEEKTEEAK